MNFIDMLDRELHEECGVFGVYNVENAAEVTYYGLHALQHRGQEGCGIVTVDHEKFYKQKGLGLVTEVFDDAKIKVLSGNMAIGHVRYSTAGGGGIENVQPFYFNHHTGNFALAHNGNIVNSNELKRFLEEKGSIFQSTSDSEILAHLIKKDSNEMHRIDSILESLQMLEGGFAFIIMSMDKLYACRYYYVLRPLSFGKMNCGFVVASVTCAFVVVNASFIRDIAPGEVVVIDRNGLKSYDYSRYKRYHMCAMEYIYFARPDSDIEGRNVHAFRKETGRLLYKEFAEESGIPYEMGLIKNKYVGRTFIVPSQSAREKGVRMKLSAVTSIVKNKKIILIDDSLVRGTTSKKIVSLLREAGAKEVHVRIASPQITNPCFYGVDTSTYEELISAFHSVDEVRELIGADSLHFMSKEALYQAAKRNDLCVACFTGNYPTALYQSIKEANKDGK